MEKSKITVTPEQVKENMQDVIVRTETEFGKPCTYVTVRMKNGFTLRESTTCVDPANYDEEIGKQICLEKIEDKVWFLLGYALQDKVANEPKGFFERLVKEHEELSIRLAKLTEYLECTSSSAIIDRIGVTQYELLLKQKSAMSLYQEILYNRIKRLEENK